MKFLKLTLLDDLKDIRINFEKVGYYREIYDVGENIHYTEIAFSAHPAIIGVAEKMNEIDKLLDLNFDEELDD